MIADWNIENMTGYKPLTTFYTDFSIAEMFGEDAVKDTCARAFKEWKGNVEYLTELVMVLNWKIWEHWNEGCDEGSAKNRMARLYNALWENLNDWCCKELKGEALEYFLTTTD